MSGEATVPELKLSHDGRLLTGIWHDREGRRQVIQLVQSWPHPDSCYEPHDHLRGFAAALGAAVVGGEQHG